MRFFIYAFSSWLGAAVLGLVIIALMDMNPPVAVVFLSLILGLLLFWWLIIKPPSIGAPLGAGLTAIGPQPVPMKAGK